MKAALCLTVITSVCLFAACDRQPPAADASTPASDEPAAPTPEPEVAAVSPESAALESKEIVPGLNMRILRDGSGEAAESGQVAVVHYTGWLYEANAVDHRGPKFDSSKDHGTPFEFSIGGGEVIKGWDQGVAGMRVGEVRELTIAPELAYGERGAGGVIPPGASLVFEVELIDLR